MSSGNLPPLASKYFIAEPAHHLELVFKRICLMAEKETSTVPVSVQHGNMQDSSVFFHVCFSVCVCMLMQVVCGIAVLVACHRAVCNSIATPLWFTGGGCGALGGRVEMDFWV